MTTDNEPGEANGDEGFTCPFCRESDFDLIGLKFHLGSCEAFDEVQAISNPMVESGVSAPTVTADQVKAAAESIAKRYAVGKGSVAVIEAIITRNLAAPVKREDAVEWLGYAKAELECHVEWWNELDQPHFKARARQAAAMVEDIEKVLATTSPETPVGGEVQEPPNIVHVTVCRVCGQTGLHNTRCAKCGKKLTFEDEIEYRRCGAGGSSLEDLALQVAEYLEGNRFEHRIQLAHALRAKVESVRAAAPVVPAAGDDEGETKGCCQRGHYHINMYGHPAKRLCRCPLNTDNRWICAAALRAAALRSGSRLEKEKRRS